MGRTVKLELSRRTDLALRSLRTLSVRGERLPRTELAEAAGTSPDFLAKVLAPLVRRGLLRSEPGRGGGYELVADLSTVTMLELITLTEGLPPDDRCVLQASACDAADPCALHLAWTDARAALYDTLDGTTVAEHTRG